VLFSLNQSQSSDLFGPTAFAPQTLPGTERHFYGTILSLPAIVVTRPQAGTKAIFPFKQAVFNGREPFGGGMEKLVLPFFAR